MNKIQRTLLVIQLNWLALLAAIMAHVFIFGPRLEVTESLFLWLSQGTFMWFVFSFMLLIFVLPILKGSVRGLTLMCFMLLLYVCMFVLFGATPNEPLNMLMGSIETLLSTTLFTLSIYYIRWKKAEMRHSSDLKTESVTQGK